MADRVIDTRFGPVAVKVHRLVDGWRAMPVGRHLLPWPPELDATVAQSQEDAVAQLARAVEGMRVPVPEQRQRRRPPLPVSRPARAW